MRKHLDGLVDDLATVELFSTCTRRELEKIAALCTPLSVSAGFVLTTQGGPGLECFVIVDGTAAVTVDGHPVATVGAGECVGEMALVDGGRRSATVTATTPMQVYVLTGSEFRTMIDTNPEVHRKVTAHLVERLRAAQHTRDRSAHRDGAAPRWPPRDPRRPRSGCPARGGARGVADGARLSRRSPRRRGPP